MLFLIFVGATVRVTGAGMGCPDWPTCWGLLIPPTDVEQVNFEKLPVEKFQQKAERMGRDPSTITRETFRNDFNPRHVWTEFIKPSVQPARRLLRVGDIHRLISAGENPTSYFLAVIRRTSSGFGKCDHGCQSRLQWYLPRRPFHSPRTGDGPYMRLGILCLGGFGHRIQTSTRSQSGFSRILVAVLLATVILEGILGSQIREMTDELAKSHLDSPRETWIGGLETSGIYLTHRSFSWVILDADRLGVSSRTKSPARRNDAESEREFWLS